MSWWQGLGGDRKLIVYMGALSERGSFSIHVEYADGREVDPSIIRTVAKQMMRSTHPPTLLYVATRDWKSFKVGITINPDRRVQQLGAYLLKRLWFQSKYEARLVESRLHELFRLQGKHVEGEWFRLTEADYTWISSLSGKDGFDADREILAEIWKLLDRE